MGTKYPGVTSSGYNSSAPIDDGSQVASNLITWAGVKTKIGDPVKTLADSMNTALVTALDISARAISGNDTAIASDHLRTLQVTGTTAITLSSAASMGVYEVGVFNAGVGVVTVTPSGSDTINLVSSSVTILSKGTMIFRTNQALTGYNVVSQSVNGSSQTVTKRKTADESVTSSTALQDDDHLTFAIAANEEWVAQINLLSVTGASAGGFKPAVTAPAGATLQLSAAWLGATATDAFAAQTTTSGAAIFTLAPATSATGRVIVNIWVLNGATPGSVTLQWAQGASNVTATTVVKGAFLQATRVA